MLLRPGTPDDASAVAEVNVATWRAAFCGVIPDAFLDGLTAAGRRDAFREMLIGQSPPGARTTVAELDGRIVGFVAWGPSRDVDAAHDTGEIYAIYVHEERWGSGSTNEPVTEVVLDFGCEKLTMAEAGATHDLHSTYFDPSRAAFVAFVNSALPDDSELSKLR